MPQNDYFLVSIHMYQSLRFVHLLNKEILHLAAWHNRNVMLTEMRSDVVKLYKNVVFENLRK